MKTINIFALILLTVTVFLFGYFVGCSRPTLVRAETNSVDSETTDKRIQIFEWEVSSDVTLKIVIKRLTKGCDKDIGFSSCDELTVLDQKGKKLFRLEDFRINLAEFSNLIRNGVQAIIRTNGGGTDDFLTILDYRNGKVVEILDTEEDTGIRGGYWTMPEYRSGNSGSYFKPNQIFLIQQIGGSDPNPTASIFRYRDGFYKKVGEIRMQKLGDFIEGEIAKK